MRHLLIQLDGSMPNLALMRLASHLRRRGEHVELRQVRSKSPEFRFDLFERWDAVYGSLIFQKTLPIAEKLRAVFPDVVLGGTGWNLESTLEEGFGVSPEEKPDYSDFPSFPHSLGFTQRGCRLSCKFCVVDEKEGRVQKVATVDDIWRGDPWPRNIVLLDNDFFGEKGWRAEIERIRAGNFRVNWNQGFNVRLIGDEEAAAIASINYFDADFRRRRLYTAWDNARDEDRLFRNLETLVRHGVKPSAIMVYMLIGFDHRTASECPKLTADDFYRHDRLREFGCDPYPMPFVRNRETLGFQRWICGHYDRRISWSEWERAGYDPRRLGGAA